jgi:hypothetical protein
MLRSSLIVVEYESIPLQAPLPMHRILLSNDISVIDLCHDQFLESNMIFHHPPTHPYIYMYIVLFLFSVGFRRCSDLYHDQVQTPNFPTGDGSCAKPCDCGVPCGRYLWDTRNPDLVDWLVNDHLTGNFR